MAWDAVTVDRGAFGRVFPEVDFGNMVHQRLHGVHDYLRIGINAIDFIQGI